MFLDARRPTDDRTRFARFLDDSVGGFTDIWSAHGDTAVFPHGGQRTVFVSGTANNRVLFSRNDALHVSIGLPGPRNSAQRAFARGIFGLNGDEHHAARRLFLPLFRNGAVAAYHDRLTGYIGTMVGGWRAGQTRDLYREMKAISLAVTTGMLFGIDEPELAARADAAFDTWLDLNHRAGFASALGVENATGAEYGQLIEAGEVLADLLRDVIAARQKRPATGDDLLAPVLAARATGALTDNDVLGLVHTLFNAAHHTTTSALTWTLFLIAQHPEVNAALLDELTGDTPARGLLDHVIKESMRILPPVVYVSRVSVAPVQFGAVEVPAKSIVIGGLYTTMHAPSAFPQPERFDPHRWEHHAACPYSNVPFGAGSRMCLGAPLATHLMQIALGYIVPRFRLAVVPGSRIDRRASLTLRPDPGIPVLIRAQDRNFATSSVTGAIHEMVELPDPTTITTRVAA
jgi:cytochrome P450